MKRLGIAAAMAALSCVWAIPVFAQPTLTAQSLTMTPGSTAELRIAVSNPENVYQGINVKLVLPKGITAIGAASGKVNAEGVVSDAFTTVVGNKRIATALTYSIFESVADVSGTILRITLTASTDLAKLGLATADKVDAPIVFSASGLVGGNTQVSIDHLVVDGLLQIRKNPFGDVDNDGQVTASDLQRVINASLGMGSPAELLAADLNGDGVVNAIDIQLQVNATLGIYVPSSGNGKDNLPGDAPTAYAEVLPAPRPGDSAILIVSDSFLYVRMRSDEPIDGDSVVGSVTYLGTTMANVAWLPLAANDGWVVFAQSVPWEIGETIMMTARANTVDGAELDPVTHTFRVTQLSDGGTEVYQPNYEEYDASALVMSLEDDSFVSLLEQSEGEGIPELAEGMGSLYTIAPEQVFEIPQRVWLPIPAGIPAVAVHPYLYLEGDNASGWFPAEQVDAWVDFESYMHLELNGVRYLGFVVQHGGTVQLGPATE